MNYDLLNKMIDYIEDNLEEDIKYEDLAKIVGVSLYSLERIFIFITNISIAEYIRVRRLSKALEEIKTTNNKIIDIAIKYGYSSSISFTRAFKKYFGVTPSECKNNSFDNYKLFTVIRFNENNNLCRELNYEIKDFEGIDLYCFNVVATREDDLLFKIREIYNEIIDNGIFDEMDKFGMYGISVREKEKYTYYVGSSCKFPNTSKFTIPKGKYAVFCVNSINQKDIVETENMVYSQWISSTNYKVFNDFDFELYKDGKCYLYIPIEDKQN